MEVEELRDNVRTACNEFHFMREVDKAMNRKVRASLKKRKRWLILAVDRAVNCEVRTQMFLQCPFTLT